jgi:hypothetical protein
LVVANLNSNDLSIFLGDGAGNLSTAMNVPAGAGPTSVAVEDLNADGNSDLVVANSGAPNISVLTGNGLGGFPTMNSYTVGIHPSSVVISDFKGDNKLDVAVGDYNSSKVAILLNTGGGAFGPATEFRTGGSPSYLAVGDFNFDGAADLAAANGTDPFGTLAILKNTCGAIPAPLPSLTINDVSMMETDAAGTSASFTVNLSNSSNRTISVSYLLRPETATSGSDFKNVSGRLILAPGQVTQSIVIPLVGDILDEFDESFSVNLVYPLNAPIADARGVGIIIDNDPEPNVSINDVLVTEGNNGTPIANLTVSLSMVSGKPISLQYSTQNGSATSGVDYLSTAGTVSIAPGSLSANVPVQIKGDTTFETDENFIVTLSNPTNVVIDDGQGQVTITNDDPLPAITVDDVNVLEGQSGTTSANFRVRLANASYQTVEVSYSTANGTATAGNDYVATSGTLTFAPGETETIIATTISGDGSVEPDETFFLNFSSPVNARIGDGQGKATILNDDVGVQFTATSYDVVEGAKRLNITVMRIGDLSGNTAVNYLTTDTDTFTVGCADTVKNQGGAFGRCDFATSFDTLTFTAGESSKTLSIPILDDSWAEGNETFSVGLINPTGASLLSPSTTIVTIIDNETVNGPNPIFTTPFFVRQHYLDFLSREPEAGEPWTEVLNNCSDVNNNPACDRLTVSAAFFGSPEFRLKGYFVYRFYKLAFNRLPLYSEIVLDMRAVTGQTPGEVFQKKATFSNSFAQRAEFTTAYGGLTPAQYVAALMDRYSLTQITTPDPAAPDGTNKVTLTRADLTTQLSGGTLTRAQVLRAIADSDQVLSLEFNQAFVAMQYYGYLRRTPEAAGYNAWLTYLNEHPTESRTMVNGLMNSTEYRLRFGPQ